MEYCFYLKLKTITTFYKFIENVSTINRLGNVFSSTIKCLVSSTAMSYDPFLSDGMTSNKT